MAEYTRHKHKEVEACRKCNGFGYTNEYEKHDYLEKGDTHRVPCQFCNSTGRVFVEKKTVITVTPFENE
jgi:hypothetical protein